MRCVRALILSLILLASAPAAAYEIKISEESSLNIDFLLQTWAQFNENGSPYQDEWSKDFFVRRARFLLFGKVNKYISFFMETEQANWGLNGDWSSSMFLQDAFASFAAVQDHLIVDVGLILLPFTRHNTQGAIGLSGLDYHSALIRFPAGTHKVWRDVGVQLRGYFLDKTLQYRLGVFGGSQGQTLQTDEASSAKVYSNPSELPRVTGRVQYNILGTEADLFGKGIYFAKEPILSVGAGVDFVPDAVLSGLAEFDATGNITRDAVLEHRWGVSGDLFADIPIGESMEIVGQATFVLYAAGDVKSENGWGILSELGFRYEQIQPIVGFDYFDSEDPSGMRDYQSIQGGLNYWILTHKANLKARYSANKIGEGDWLSSLAIQAQLFF
ncbi:MAG: hypothetical protein RBU37_12960 [Myxococcota bacterium]|jgi:hypothetical protein|nr:hypothetical protein [Myxococcota bacterium]